MGKGECISAVEVSMNALHIERLTFTSSKAKKLGIMGISHLDPFAKTQNVHFGHDNCLVGISIANTENHKVNSIKFWYQEFDFKD